MKLSILSILALVAASAVAHPAPAHKCHPKHHAKAPAVPTTVADNYGYGAADVTQAAPTQVAAPVDGGLYGDDKAQLAPAPAKPTGAYDGAAPAPAAGAEPTGSYDAPAPAYGKRPAPAKGGDKSPSKGDKTPGHYGKNPHYKPDRQAYPCPRTCDSLTDKFHPFSRS
ncbi:hypothetical protein BCR44DRAFT_1116270 [Catenaria anguillulae PL171]|uniref:Uncharacterized protein n=1 Tax=Catenaria anguillulae PL171 TaxID=765915 RepID=A0A1Y2HNZ8_9FUNG|nr:hypothetical protein BCR44DRAFT_1116270 [Catenaria anguillulae PL171]